MRIVSYNVNGIRAAIKKNLLDWISSDNADVYCFQELKANEEDINQELFEHLGYHCFWFPAAKKGYSGVGVLSKKKPLNIEKGMGIKQADDEGRVIKIEYDNLAIVNTYFPSGSSGDERQDYKMQFLSDYISFTKALIKKHKRLIIAGDYNICHKEIDIHNPIANKNTSGFLPEERAWMDDFFNLGMLDAFRQINMHKDQYTWWSYRANARANNKGWRIDYLNCSQAMQKDIVDAGILPEAVHSDHCPVFLKIK